MIAISNLKYFFAKGLADLKNAGIETPTREVGVIICEILDCDESFLYSHDDYIFTDAEKKIFDEMITKRASGMPLAYVTGHCEFMSLDFNVNQNVLIPRQDTEILCEFVIDFAKKNFLPKESNITEESNMPEKSNKDDFLSEKRLNILDIGAGSGCIGISLAHHLKNAFVTELDKSEEALNVAKINAQNNNVTDRVGFVKLDILNCDFSEILSHDTVSKNAENPVTGKFDIIVSNPPYITDSEMSELDKEVVDFEPADALRGGSDGLDFYKVICENARKTLTPKGLLAFEVGYKQSSDVMKIMAEKFYEIEITKDLSGIERVVSGKLFRPESE